MTPPKTTPRTATTRRIIRRYVFRDEAMDLEAAAKIGTRLHVALVKLAETSAPFSQAWMVIGVAYFQDMTVARGKDVPPVYPEDVSDVVGMGRGLTKAYCGDAARAGLLDGNAQAGYYLPIDWFD